MPYDLILICALSLCYLAAGHAKWRLFKILAPDTEEDQAVVEASEHGNWKMRLGAVVMVLTWPLWDECVGLALWVSKRFKKPDVQWMDANTLPELQPAAIGEPVIRRRENRA